MAGNKAACYKDAPILADDVTAAQQYVRWVRQAARMDLADLCDWMRADADALVKPLPTDDDRVTVGAERFR